MYDKFSVVNVLLEAVSVNINKLSLKPNHELVLKLKSLQSFQHYYTLYTLFKNENSGTFYERFFYSVKEIQNPIFKKFIFNLMQYFSKGRNL